MAAKKTKANVGLAADDSSTIPRISLGEAGFTGLRTSNGRILDDPNNIFKFPAFISQASQADSGEKASETRGSFHRFPYVKLHHILICSLRHMNF